MSFSPLNAGLESVGHSRNEVLWVCITDERPEPLRVHSYGSSHAATFQLSLVTKIYFRSIDYGREGQVDSAGYGDMLVAGDRRWLTTQGTGTAEEQLAKKFSCRMH